MMYKHKFYTLKDYEYNGVFQMKLYLYDIIRGNYVVNKNYNKEIVIFFSTEFYKKYKDLINIKYENDKKYTIIHGNKVYFSDLLNIDDVLVDSDEECYKYLRKLDRSKKLKKLKSE